TADNGDGAAFVIGSSTAIAESDILLTDDQAKTLPENRVEAGTNYTIFVPRQSNVRDHTKALQEASSSAILTEEVLENAE
ncbi:hypothetical protein GCK32_021691, partial [Trichostrongylus colubriformis]